MVNAFEKAMLEKAKPIVMGRKGVKKIAVADIFLQLNQDREPKGLPTFNGKAFKPSIHKKTPKEDYEKVVKENFAKADKNKDGKLDNEELKGFLAECVKSAGMPKADAEKIENEGITTMWQGLF